MQVLPEAVGLMDGLHAQNQPPDLSQSQARRQKPPRGSKLLRSVPLVWGYSTSSTQLLAHCLAGPQLPQIGRRVNQQQSLKQRLRFPRYRSLPSDCYAVEPTLSVRECSPRLNAKLHQLQQEPCRSRL